MRVLVVEDNADLRSLLEAWLGHAGCEVICTITAEEALARLPSFAPDVILSDLGLPGMDGLELIRAVRADPEHRRMPVLLLSGMTLDPRLEAVDALPGTAVMEKPPVWKTVVPTLRRLVSGVADQPMPLPSQ